MATKKEEAAAKKAAKARKTSAAIGQATKRRTQWEGTPEGKARITSPLEAQNPGMPLRHVYEHHGFKDETPARAHNQMILPGMSSPGDAPTHPRWEDLEPHEQAKTEKALRLRGTNIGQMAHDLGSQIDQAFVRSQGAHMAAGVQGPPDVVGRDWYGDHSEHAQIVHQTAQEHGIHPSVMSAVVAHTSPNTKWKQGDVYPNIEVAKHVVRHIMSGGDPSTVHEQAFARDAQGNTALNKDGQPKKLQGYGTNMIKAATQLKAHLDSGEAFHSFGPKTGVFHNAFNPHAEQHYTVDVHSGGAAVPHLSTEKPIKVDKDGNKVRKPKYRNDPRPDSELGENAYDRHKSEREAAIETVPNFHAAVDHAARTAMAKRGLSSLRSVQSIQWHEEQIQRTEKQPKMALGSTESSYGHLKGEQAKRTRESHNPNQESFF